MTPLKPVDQQNQTLHRVVLLAADSSNSVMSEMVNGKSNRITYSAYGEQSAQQDVDTRMGFNGQLRETTMGWYLLGNGYRAYNPKLMRFHSPDSWSPFGRGGLNAYMYCVGDPVNHSDPTGHSIFGAIKLFVGENVSFGGSAAQLATQNVTRRANGIARQQSMYKLAAAGGTPTIGSRPSTSSGFSEMLSYIAGAPSPRGNRSPAIQYVEQKPKRYAGYEGAAINSSGFYSPSRSTSQPTVASGSGGAGRPRSNSFDAPRTLHNGPTTFTPVLVNERLLGGSPHSSPLPPPPPPPPPPSPASSSPSSATSRGSTPPRSSNNSGGRNAVNFDELASRLSFLRR